VESGEFRRKNALPKKRGEELECREKTQKTSRCNFNNKRKKFQVKKYTPQPKREKRREATGGGNYRICRKERIAQKKRVHPRQKGRKR